MNTVITNSIIHFLALGAFAVVGALTVKRAEETASKAAGYIVLSIGGQPLFN